MATLFGNGFKQADLIDLLVTIKTNFNAVLAKLDLDTAVADTNYNSLWALSIPEGIQIVDAKCIRDQGQVVTFLQNVITNFNAVLAKLDLDATVTQTDYASTLALTDTIGMDALDKILNIGTNQGSVINLLKAIITNFNALNVKLDTDNTDTNYASLWNITDVVDSTGTVSR